MDRAYERLAFAHADAHARPHAPKAVVDRAVELAQGFRGDATKLLPETLGWHIDVDS